MAGGNDGFEGAYEITDPTQVRELLTSLIFPCLLLFRQSLL